MSGATDFTHKALLRPCCVTVNTHSNVTQFHVSVATKMLLWVEWKTSESEQLTLLNMTYWLEQGLIIDRPWLVSMVTQSGRD